MRIILLFQHYDRGFVNYCYIKKYDRVQKILKMKVKNFPDFSMKCMI